MSFKDCQCIIKFSSKEILFTQRINWQDCQNRKFFMRTAFILLIFAMTLILSACKRENSYEDCMPDVKTVSTLINVQGKIVGIDSPAKYEIFVGNGADTLAYVPCNLPESFQVQNLKVTVSGLVKYTLDPCFFGYCPQGFVITNISK